MSRRLRAGTKASDLFSWPTQDIKEINGPFKAQEFLQQMIRKFKIISKLSNRK